MPLRPAQLARLGVLVLAAMTVASPGAADDLYVPTVHLILADGAYRTFPLAGTESGLGLVECQMRLELWRDEHLAAFEAAGEQLRAEGKSAGIDTSCERK